MSNPGISEKPVHVKPSLYAFYYMTLKELAKKYGYNLLLHGSLHTDLDLVAVPWGKELLPHDEMIKEFAVILGGYVLEDDRRVVQHGRIIYVININRGKKFDHVDEKYYLDISVIPPPQ